MRVTSISIIFSVMTWGMISFSPYTMLTLTICCRTEAQSGAPGPVQHLPDHPAQLPAPPHRPPQHELQQADLRPLHRPLQHDQPAHPRPVQQLPAQPPAHGLAHHAQAADTLPGQQPLQEPGQRELPQPGQTGVTRHFLHGPRLCQGKINGQHIEIMISLYKS